MSWAADILASVKGVMLLEDRVARLDASVEALTAKLSRHTRPRDTAGRPD